MATTEDEVATQERNGRAPEDGGPGGGARTGETGASGRGHVEQRSGVGQFALAQRPQIDALYAAGGARSQAMRGFEPVYSDIVDYIVRCTHRIWEEQGVGLIYTHYAHNSVVHAGNGESYGREEVVANTLKSMAGMPDRKLYADDVIWAGDEDSGFHTSHHLTEVGHNTGYTSWGPPTGKRVVYRAIANCFVKENLIVEEWLLGDEIAAIRQLGRDPDEIARASARAALATGRRFTATGPLQRGLGQLMPDAEPPGLSGRTDGVFDPEDFVRTAFHEVWNWRMLNRLRDYYAPNHRCRTASGRRYAGTDDLAAFYLTLMAAMPDCKMTVDHVYWNGSDDEGYRVAVRWTLAGTHDGPGEWGEPSGARVDMMGLSHLRIERVAGRHVFVEESTLFDELAMLTSIWAARLTAGGGWYSAGHGPGEDEASF